MGNVQRNLTIKSRTLEELEHYIPGTFATVHLDVFQKVRWVCVFRVAQCCAKCWVECWNV